MLGSSKTFSHIFKIVGSTAEIVHFFNFQNCFSLLALLIYKYTSCISGKREKKLYRKIANSILCRMEFFFWLRLLTDSYETHMRLVWVCTENCIENCMRLTRENFCLCTYKAIIAYFDCYSSRIFQINLFFSDPSRITTQPSMDNEKQRQRFFGNNCFILKYCTNFKIREYLLHENLWFEPEREVWKLKKRMFTFFVG